MYVRERQRQTERRRDRERESERERVKSIYGVLEGSRSSGTDETKYWLSPSWDRNEKSYVDPSLFRCRGKDSRRIEKFSKTTTENWVNQENHFQSHLSIISEVLRLYGSKTVLKKERKFSIKIFTWPSNYIHYQLLSSRSIRRRVIPTSIPDQR